MIQAVILAGGQGLRLASRSGGRPKPLVRVAGVPLLERQLKALKDHGLEDVLVLVNHQAAAIEEFLRGQNDFGLRIVLADDGEPRGTAGALLAALPTIRPEAENLLILYGDTLFNVDFDRFLRFHNEHEAEATLFLHPNDHPHDSDLVEMDENRRIRRIHPYPHPQGAEYPNLVNAALYVIRRAALAPWEHIAREAPRTVDFAKELFPRMLAAGQRLCGYNSPEYIKDIGTPERLDRAEEAVRSGRFAGASLKTPQAAVFLDRDGVINKEVGHLSRKEDLVLLPGAARAIRKLNQSGLLSVVVTNQPVIARGECSEPGLAEIHARLDTLLGREGAYIDRLYYCPHHPDKGFAGERADLKRPCACRKPAPGLLEEAARDLHIDFSRSWLIGDRTGDILAARRAGVRSILLRTGAAGLDGAYAVKPDYTADSLEEACALILEEPAARLAGKEAQLADIEKYFKTLKETLDALDREALQGLLGLLLRAREEGRNIFVMGNGGSAATASHFVCDFNKGLRREDGKNFRFICLNDNVPSLMAIANDLGYEAVFVEQLKSHLAPGDVVMGLSGSGNSANVVKALEYARERGAETVALVGYDGGRMKGLARHTVHVPLNDMQIVEDIHMILDHMSMRVVSRQDRPKARGGRP